MRRDHKSHMGSLRQLNFCRAQLVPSRISHKLFFFTTSTFLHDFNFPAPLKHLGMTLTFRHDFFWHDFFYGTTFNFFHRKTERKNQRGRSPLANRKVFTVILFGKNYE